MEMVLSKLISMSITVRISLRMCGRSLKTKLKTDLKFEEKMKSPQILPLIYFQFGYVCKFFMGCLIQKKCKKQKKIRTCLRKEA